MPPVIFLRKFNFCKSQVSFSLLSLLSSGADGTCGSSFTVPDLFSLISAKAMEIMVRTSFTIPAMETQAKLYASQHALDGRLS